MNHHFHLHRQTSAAAEYCSSALCVHTLWPRGRVAPLPLLLRPCQLQLQHLHGRLPLAAAVAADGNRLGWRRRRRHDGCSRLRRWPLLRCGGEAVPRTHGIRNGRGGKRVGLCSCRVGFLLSLCPLQQVLHCMGMASMDSRMTGDRVWAPQSRFQAVNAQKVSTSDGQTEKHTRLAFQLQKRHMHGRL